MTTDQKSEVASVYQTADIDAQAIQSDIDLALASDSFGQYVETGGRIGYDIQFYRLRRCFPPRRIGGGMSYGFVAFNGAVWTDSQVDQYNRYYRNKYLPLFRRGIVPESVSNGLHNLFCQFSGLN